MIFNWMMLKPCNRSFGGRKLYPAPVIRWSKANLDVMVTLSFGLTLPSFSAIFETFLHLVFDLAQPTS